MIEIEELKEVVATLEATFAPIKASDVTVEEVVAHVRQSNMGSDAGANAASPTRCQS